MISKIDENLIIIGTSHISKGSIREIRNAFTEFNPDLIGVELDKNRMYALQNKQRKKRYSLRMIKDIGLGGFLFAIIANYTSKKLGKIVDTEPGEDMLEGIKLAKENAKSILLVDQDIKITLRDISRIRFKDKIKMSFRTILLMFNNKEKQKLKRINLSSIPSNESIEYALSFLKRNYPVLYNVLLVKRNRHIFQVIIRYKSRYPNKKIMVLLGAAHVKGVVGLLNNYYRTDQN
jgi:pheromone shutdown protein TraB